MKLLLTSAGLQNKKVADCFVSALPKKPQDCSVLLISYAQNETEESYAEESVQELVALGLKDLSYFNLRNDSFDGTRTYDAIYVCGGNTFAILSRMRAVGLDKFILDMVRAGNSLYVGVSAGSIIAGPSIKIAGWGSEGDANDVGLKDLTGFGFTDILVFPHFKPQLKQEVDECRKMTGADVIELTDDEAIYIDEAGYKCL